MKKTGCREALQCNLEQAIENLSTAFKEYKNAKQDSGMWRNEFLESLEKAKAEKKGTAEALEKRLSHQIGRQRRQAQNVRRMLGKMGQGRVTHLFFTNAENERILCDTQEKMVSACVRENEARFSQSEKMPPMTDPLYQDLGLYGETVEAQQILFGSYAYPSGIDPYARELLEAMRMPTIVRQEGPVHTDIHIDEHTKGWRKQKESTSSEPSGLTFSHFKAALEDEALTKVDLLIRQLPYRHGFSPESWRNITDVQILKKAGVFDVEKMRTIQLMHAEFNMNNKKLGRNMMAFAKKCNVLGPEQFGSRKNH